MKKDNNNTNLPARNEQSETTSSATKDRPSRGLKLQSNIKAGIFRNPPGILKNHDDPGDGEGGDEALE